MFRFSFFRPCASSLALALMFALMCGPLAADAQEGLYFGARGGLSFSNARVRFYGSETDPWGNTTSGEVNLSNELYAMAGGTVGAVARWNFTRWFGLQSGLDYYQLRNQMENGDSDYYNEYGVLSARDYLHFPLTAVFTGDLNGPKIRFGLGPYLSVLTRARQMNPYYYRYRNSHPGLSESYDERDAYRPLLFGIEINPGIDFRLGDRMRFSYDIVIRHSVTSAARRAPELVPSTLSYDSAPMQVGDYREHNVFVGMVVGLGAFFPRNSATPNAP